MRVGFGNGGWVAIDGVDLPGPLYVRVRDVDGRLRISEFYLDASASGVIEHQDFRDIPLRQLESFINHHAADEVRARIDCPSPDLSVLASYYSTSFGNYEKQMAEGNWVVASFAAQLLPPGENRGQLATSAELDLPVMRVPRSRRKWKNIHETDESFRLASGPPTDGLTDEFLRDVSRAYAAAVVRGERPNKAIAEQVDYPIKTVQRWVYTARQRGVMPRGTKGAAG